MAGSKTTSSWPLATLLQDEFRRGWWKLASAQTAALGTAAVVYRLLQSDGAVDPQAGRTLHLVLLWIVYAAAAGAALAASGDPARLSLLPLSNRQIAVVVMFPGMIYVGLIYLLTAVGLNIIFAADWPLWGPALYLGSVMGVMKALSLAVGESHFRRLVCWCLAGIFLEDWLCRRYGGSFLHPATMWQHVTPAELMALSLMVGGAYLLGANSLARARCGETAILALFSGGFSWAQRELSGPNLPFRNQQRAQFWFEWRQKGLILPALITVLLSLLVTGFLLNQFEKGTYELLHVSFGYGGGLCPMALVVGLVMGHLDPASTNPECGSFLATRPATNAALSSAVLMSAAASLLVAWGMWCLAMIVSTVVLYLDQGQEPVLDLWTNHGKFSLTLTTLGYGYAAMIFALVLLAAWIPLSLAASLVLTGRQRLLVGFVSGGIPVLLTGLLMAGQSESGRPLLPAVVWHYLAGASAMFGTAWIWFAALRRNQVSGTNAGLALSGWVALCGVAMGVYVLIGALDASDLVMLGGLLALPFAAFAAAPLALAWNRHR